MNQQAGLAFEQAPPFSLPLRFFLTAPLFLLAAAALIVLSPEALASRWTPQALALTHTLTLGFLAMVMLGALMQMLPVVAGSPLPAPRLVTWLSHIPLTAGTLALAGGFLSGEPLAFGLGVLLLAGGLTVFVIAAFQSLVHAMTGVTATGIWLAVLCLVATILLGLALALLRAGWWLPPQVDLVIDTHVIVGLLGWVLLLVIGVAYQVVPMFQITPPYPPRLSRWLIPGMFLLLLLHAFAALLHQTAAQIINTGLAIGVLLFAFSTLRLQARRRRKLPDVTLDYWRVGMGSLIACVVIWGMAQLFPGWSDSDTYPLLLGVLFVGGFAVSVISGMLYKIVPFLAWFHLQAQLQARAGTIPTMKEMIHPGWMRTQFRLHLAACALLAAATFWLPLAGVAGSVLGVSALILWVNLLSAVRRFYACGGRLN